IVEQEESVLGEGESDEGKDKNLSTGLTMLDARSIERVIPGIEKVSPEIFIDTYIIKNAFRRSAKLVGVENSYFDLSGFELYEGKLFNQIHLDYGKPVCIIGKSIKAKFFSKENPIGKKIKVGNHWLKVIGVLEERHISKKSISNLGIRDYNMDVYTPLKTVLIRYENRALITEAAIKLFNRSNPEEREKSPNYHQLDRLVIQVSETDKLNGVVQVISKILKRRHKDIVDYEISIPELLLKQQQRTKSIFNFVLGAIAGISLLVGGIGIMNIMLASVLERIKEIGLRMSIGAKKADIAYQFLLEAVMISVSGGLVGVVLGSSIAVGVSELAEIPTILSFYSILLSFGVAVSIGVIFGYAPAKRAAEQDPITSLRYE
ncbi:MAG: ABC transporter permease, partial [Cyclobacteriaceae bacterium]|nr:ABC transporter permease [Cyclobacteriaceae bacterium]